MILPDVLAPGLHLVFCGTAPSRASKEAGAYYAKPGNRFWPTLRTLGLVPPDFVPARFAEAPRYGFGLTDLNKTEFGTDDQLSRDAFDTAGFRRKMRRYRPAAIAFTSKNAGRAFLGRQPAQYGRQAETLDGIPLYVLPSPSGLATGFWSLVPWHEAVAFVLERREREDTARQR